MRLFFLLLTVLFGLAGCTLLSSDDTTREKQLYLTVIKPQQFEEEQQYMLSIELRADESTDHKFFNLLGYTKKVVTTQ